MRTKSVSRWPPRFVLTLPPPHEPIFIARRPVLVISAAVQIPRRASPPTLPLFLVTPNLPKKNIYMTTTVHPPLPAGIGLTTGFLSKTVWLVRNFIVVSVAVRLRIMLMTIWFFPMPNRKASSVSITSGYGKKKTGPAIVISVNLPPVVIFVTTPKEIFFTNQPVLKDVILSRSSANP